MNTRRATYTAFAAAGCALTAAVLLGGPGDPFGRLTLEAACQTGTLVEVEVWMRDIQQANTEVTVVNFRPRILGYTTVIQANAQLSTALVLTALSGLISPTARNQDGQTFVWDFGGRVPNTRVSSEIFAISPGNVFDADVTSPVEDTVLAEDELPILDTANTNVSITNP